MLQQPLDQIPITKLTGVGPKTASFLAKLGIYVVQDLLLHLPYRYEDRTRLTPIGSLQIGKSAAIVGEVGAIQATYKRRPMLLCQIKDQTGRLTIRFFNFSKQRLQFTLRPGVFLFCYGELQFVGNSVEMVHPEYRILKADSPLPVETFLTPIYPATEGLSQTVLRKLIKQALNIFINSTEINEYIPAALLDNLHLPTIREVIVNLHQPSKEIDPLLLEKREHLFRQRLIFEELLAMQLSLLKIKGEIKTLRSPKISWDNNINLRFIKELPFTLTAAQLRVANEIKNDLVCDQPMLRLLQGDVGCGKTIIAVMALLQAINAGYQAALMVPTEILATQHYQNILAWLKSFNCQVVLLAGKISGKKRKTLLNNIGDGSAKIVIGTHALFQEKIKFFNLALIVIDEQHRFGVHQRLALWDKGFSEGKYPHQLIMTATPIPRTLAMTLYADLDCSVIDEMPQDRIPIKTVIMAKQKREQIFVKINNYCKYQGQVYWVCPLIEESDVLQCQAATTTRDELVSKLPELNIGLIHGRMHPEEKEQIMSAFKAGIINLLVATTVIEVGVDVPNANLMIIENAERLGLVQLHQLRGRVGRGNVAGNCVLLYQMPLSNLARTRLELLRDSNDGFVLARKDLELRGPGEVLGTKQTGLVNLKIADMFLDQAALPKVQRTASWIMEQYPAVADLLIKRWWRDKEKYSVV